MKKIRKKIAVQSQLVKTVIGQCNNAIFFVCLLQMVIWCIILPITPCFGHTRSRPRANVCNKFIRAPIKIKKKENRKKIIPSRENGRRAGGVQNSS